MQQMNEGGEPLRNQAERGYGAYQAEQEFRQQPYMDPYGPGSLPRGDVKIQPNTSGRVSAGQRLALAIVSVAIIGLIAIIIGSNTAVGLGSYFVLGIGVVAILFINGLFNRWGLS